MRLHSVLFQSQRAADFARMAEVLKRSVAENSPNTPLTFHEIDDTDDDVIKLARPNLRQKYIDNARKAKHHNRIIQEAKNGELLGFLDVDTCVLRDLSDIESLDFDFAYTVRPQPGQWKLNTGVYFVRVSFRLKIFSMAWFATVTDMLGREQFHDEWRKKPNAYGGIQQAALGFMLSGELGMPFRKLELPCTEWNSVNGCWHLDTNPRVVHLIGSMREYCLRGLKAPDEPTQQLADQWRAIEAKTTEAIAC